MMSCTLAYKDCNTCHCLATKVFFRQIAGYQRGVGDHRVERGSWANKIVTRP